MSQNVCPICGKDDRIQKVSSIIDSEFDKKKGITITKEPKKPLPYILYVIGMGLFCWPFFLGVSMGVCVVVLSLLIPASQIQTSRDVYFYTSLAISFCLGTILLLTFASANRKQDMKKYFEMKMSQRARSWWTLMGVIEAQCWDRLYYCHRDNVVYDTKTTKYCSPSTDEIRRLLYPND